MIHYYSASLNKCHTIEFYTHVLKICHSRLTFYNVFYFNHSNWNPLIFISLVMATKRCKIWISNMSRSKRTNNSKPLYSSHYNVVLKQWINYWLQPTTDFVCLTASIAFLKIWRKKFNEKIYFHIDYAMANHN